MFKKPFSFKGRIGRLEYGLTFVVMLVVFFIGAIILMEMFPEPTDPVEVEEVGIDTLLFVLFLIPIVWFYLAQSSKRCHDLDKSGWFQFIPLYQLWLLFGKGDARQNRFDPNSNYSSQISHPELLDTDLDIAFRKEEIDDKKIIKKQRKLFKKPLSFRGRIRRLEYGISFILFSIPFGMFREEMTLVNANPDGEMSYYAIILLLILIPVLWFTMAQNTKRCHDINLSGWYQFIPLFVFVLLFVNGTKGENKYGKNPKESISNNDTSLQDKDVISYDN